MKENGIRKDIFRRCFFWSIMLIFYIIIFAVQTIAAIKTDPWLRNAVRPESRLAAYCWCVVHKVIEPCAFQVVMEMKKEQCNGAPDIKCGHIALRHTPPDPMQNKLGTIITGGLAENQGDEVSFLLPRKDGQYFYPFYFYSGRIMGDVEVRVHAWDQSPNHKFIPPCDDIKTFTVPLNINIGFGYLQELPDSPFPPPTPFPYDWTRCGMMTGCQSGIDDAYSGQSHPTVHWGASEFLDAIDCLAAKWYLMCNNELAVTDISLPGGGLLDIENNWDTPHIRHRLGIDADLVGVSVPDTGICGEIPERCTDQKWNRTPLPELKLECDILQMRNDPGHICQYCRGGI